MEQDNKFYISQKIFLEALRKEATEAKSCVTQYSFQCLAISGAALGFIISNSKDNSSASLACIPIIFLLMIMARIAIYKYELVNRAYGFELYSKTIMGLIEDNRAVFEEEIEAWEFAIANEHWEKLFYAWRHISPTLFKKFYKVSYSSGFFSLLDPNGYKEKFNRDDKSLWILVPNKIDKSLKDNELEKASYFPGSYLNNILMMILLMQSLLIIPLVLAIGRKMTKLISLGKHDIMGIIKKIGNISIQNRFFPSSPFDDTVMKLLGLIIITVLMICFIVIRTQRINRRRQILESELFSIRTCSITWSLVARANFLSWKHAKKKILGSLPLTLLESTCLRYSLMKEYERNLTSCCSLILEHCENPSKWNLTQIIETDGIAPVADSP